MKTLDLISAISLPVAKVNGTSLARELAGTNSANTLIGAVNRNLLSEGKLFYLHFDDTDQLGSPDQPGHLNRLWGFLLAVRRLAGDCPSIRPIITLRTGVWNRLTSESRGQRDQTDHFRGYAVSLKANDDLIKDIVRKRIERAAADLGTRNSSDAYDSFFQGHQVLLPGSSESRRWDDFISKSSRNRPRDAIQLIKNMIEAADAKNSQKIGSDEANAGMGVYSSERVNDIETEFSLDCSNIRQIINTFADQDFELSFESVRQHLLTVPSIGSTTVRGSLLKPQVDADAITILALLHEVGFINPRVPDSTKKRGFDHILFSNDSNFTKLENWNEMQAATWEIHPAFRTYLLGVRESRFSSGRITIPKK
jgi:hypothetical protein